MRAPSVIVIGEVVKLRERLQWFESAVKSSLWEELGYGLKDSRADLKLDSIHSGFAAGACSAQVSRSPDLEDGSSHWPARPQRYAQ